MNLSQLAYNLVTGRWRLDALEARERFQIATATSAERLQLYAGARPGTKRPTAAPLSTPEDYTPAVERIVLIRAARQLEIDEPFFDGILGDFETFVVGELKYTPSTGNAEADKVLADFLEEEFNAADYTQREDLCGLAKLAVRSMIRDGECGGAVYDVEEAIRLQLVGGDRIGNPMTGTSADPSNFAGIIVDLATGAPVSFEIYRRTPKVNNYIFDKSIPADHFFHYFNPFRIDQYHGVSAFKNSIARGYDLRQISEYTLLNMKFRASQLPYVQNEQGKPRGNGYQETLPTGPTVANDGMPRPMTTEALGVTQMFMKLDEGVMEYPNDFPNQQFLPLTSETKREVCSGVKLPMEFLYRSETGGVVQRFYAAKAEATFRGHRHLARRKVLNPYKNRTIQAGIDSGRLDLRRFGTLIYDQARFRGTWQMGRAVPVDYARETDADLAQIEGGVMSPYDYANDNGRDLDVILAETEKYTTALIEAAERISQKTGQPMSEVLPYLSKRFPNQAPQVAGAKAAAVPSDEEDHPARAVV